MDLCKNLNNARKLIPKLLKSENRKSLLKILYEILLLLFKQRRFPVEYFSRYLFLTSAGNSYDYVPNKILYSLADKVNNKYTANILLNKYFFHLFFSQFDIPLAKLLMHNHKQVFFINNKPVRINTAEKFHDILEKTIHSKPTPNSLFIKKTYDSYGGRNIYKLNQSDFPLPPNTLNELFFEITGSNYLFQETIEQHPLLNKLNDSCINSIRCDSFTDNNGETHIMSAYLRLSISGLPVDNITSGGCLVGINTDTGRLMKYAFTSITRAGGLLFDAHPVSKVVFKDYEIPYFQESVKFIKKAAALIPEVKLIGWDIAIRPNGPLIIEGNHQYDMTMSDLAYGGYRKNKIFNKLLEEIKS